MYIPLIPHALAAAQRSRVRVIPGVELSSDYTFRGRPDHTHEASSSSPETSVTKDIHMVGLGIDYQNPEFSEHLRQFQQERHDRNVKMCQNLKDAGFDISYDALRAAFPDAILTRCHIARFLFDK